MAAYWVFNEDQLREALKVFAERRYAEAGEHQAAIEVHAIDAFLTTSREARDHKLIVETKR